MTISSHADGLPDQIPPQYRALFAPLDITIGDHTLHLRNRIAMSPMTRMVTPGGLATEETADYYTARATGGVGVIVTEGIAIDHPTAVDHLGVPRIHTDEQIAAWTKVTDQVHTAGAVIFPQLWHVGPLWGAMLPFDPDLAAAVEENPQLYPSMRPSGQWGQPGDTSYDSQLVASMRPDTAAMTSQDMQQVIDAYVASAVGCVKAGFDGVAIHGGHGYLLSSFMWSSSNQRTDEYGGSATNRVRFPAEVVAAVRAAVGPQVPIMYRFSQFTQQDYNAQVAETSEELTIFLQTLRDAGVDIFDASARRFNAPVFPGSELSLAGWAKKITGKPAMAVGGAGIATSRRESAAGAKVVKEDNFPVAHRMVQSGEFDVLTVGRLLLRRANLVNDLRNGDPFHNPSPTK